MNKFKTLFILFFIIFLTILSGYIIYQLLPNINNSFTFEPSNKNAKIKILFSETTIDLLNSQKLNIQSYSKKIEEFKNKMERNGFKCQIISEKDLPFLKKDDILIALDTYALPSYGIKHIKKFLSKGGNLIFNYRFNYYDENRRFINANTIIQITKLKKTLLYIPKNKAKFFIHKRISPINLSENPTREDLVLYDSLPIFHSKEIPDILLTNWAVTNTPILNKKHLSIYDAGIAWHGFYKKGKWFYFSFPSYVFLELNDKEFKTIFKNIQNFTQKPITISSYPFLNKKNAIFISEDTEYKYPYSYNFVKLANSQKINVTLFAVAELAKKYEKLTKKISKFKNCEIASHSYDHKNILKASLDLTALKKEIFYSKALLEKITNRKIYGFRPPQEEINNVIEYLLKRAGYIYVMEKSKKFLLPKKNVHNIITIPRHGTDDYAYLITLGFNKEKILKEIISETNFLTSINGLYTLSVHTHLLSYKSNITILKKYFKYLNNNKYFNTLKGKDIALNSQYTQNVFYKISSTNNIISLKITNANLVSLKNLTFRLYNPNIKIKTITPEILQYKIKTLLKNSYRRYIDIQINKIPPQTTITIFIKYEKL